MPEPFEAKTGEQLSTLRRILMLDILVGKGAQIGFAILFEVVET